MKNKDLVYNIIKTNLCEDISSAQMVLSINKLFKNHSNFDLQNFLHLVKIIRKEKIQISFNRDWTKRASLFKKKLTGSLSSNHSLDHITYVIAHELGHHFDKKRYDWIMLNRAYDKNKKGLKITSKEKKYYLSREIRAWKIGVPLLKVVNSDSLNSVIDSHILGILDEM